MSKKRKLKYKDEPKKCENCGKEFIPARKGQKYCGSKADKTGCSWLNEIHHPVTEYDPEENTRRKNLTELERIIYEKKYTAQRRDIKWELSKEFIRENLWKKECAYCGEKVERLGIDRVDNDKDYIPDNVVPCCTTCNKMKLDLSKERFLKKCKQIVAKQE